MVRGAGAVVLKWCFNKYFKPLPARPFRLAMQISGNASAGASYDVAVAKKVQQSTREQGEQALQLIEEATPAPAASPPAGTGGRLNVVA
jgi:hypothetical protein